MLVSVIVPVYNTEKYLGFSIESLINQTYKNIEIILINDGSTDNSLDICNYYKNIDKRIRVFNMDNNGQSYARNYGVVKARGNYIIFMDSDDFYESYAIEYLVKLQQKYNAEIVLSKIKLSGINRKTLKNYKISYEGYNVSIEEALENMYYDRYSGVSPTAKLYRKETLLKYPYPEGNIHEDTDTTYKHLFDSKKNIICGNEITYNYCTNLNSTTQGIFNERMFYYFDAMKNNRYFIEKNFKNNKDILYAWFYMYVLGGIRIYDSIIKSNLYSNYIENFDMFIKKIKNYWSYILLNRNISFKRKIKYLLFILNIRLYVKLFKLFKK